MSITDIVKMTRKPITPSFVFTPSSGNHGEPGEVWRMQSVCTTDEETEPLMVLIIDRFENIYTAAPIFSYPEMAGPNDVVLPKEIFGFEACISFSAAASVSRESLMFREGFIPEDWVTKLNKFHAYILGKEIKPTDIMHGASYIDENDPAFVFHEELAEQMNSAAKLCLSKCI